ncbi:hypothetical protein ACWT_4778 [Actinoplanes sp. SE50]|uniref:hypothetical protein n=1 Tax=unclassified Actinoplanes TaxID=2626549 RepID=UPI00023EC133|nr:MULTISPECIES: hypothetical protein [unclassified Actinoplanes]AEV85799.1 hypothetical protein ACPL_4908 [Actinoplanes sp. SE50/110]ATO84193.1 hypothetical protein ACWT_4778 [Actinoplanes sp. SE50]SLM01603.1 hypothetical protein ACSP50_4839 [Actinoplanes sp. SE50/110]
MTDWDEDVAQTFVNQDNAYVDTQIGVLHGDAHFYHVTGDAGPEEQFRVAVNYLDAGLAGEARRRIREAVMTGGLSSAEVAYRWALAVLSGRRLTDLSDEDLAALEHAFAMAGQYPSGRWWRSVAVIQGFVDALLALGPDGQPNPVACAEALRGHAALPPEDRLEIESHLGQFLAHILRDDADQRTDERVRAARLAGDRRDRVPKFFEPDPAPPVRKVPLQTPPGSAWRPVAGGAAIAALALWTLLAELGEVSILATLAVTALLGAGGWFAGRQLLERAYLASRRAAKEAELTRGERAPIERPGNQAPQEGFADAVSGLIDAAFARRQPADHSRDAFWQQTWGLRAALYGDLVDLYAHAGVPAATLAWLVNFHAGEIARRWRAGGLDEFRRDRPAAPLASPEFAGGLAALGGAAVIAVLTLLNSHFFGIVVTAGLLYLATRVGRGGAMVLYGERRRITLDTAEYAQRFDAETAAHQRRVAHLADRPTDVEMGRWLALDLAYFTRAVLLDSRLTGRDVVTQLVLTEAAAGSVRARILGGPFRHSAYTVLLFLLTEGGVRRVQARLEFASGKFVGERRDNFRYEAIVSAHVREVGVRFDDGRPRVLTDDESYALARTDKVVRREALLLNLIDGQKIPVLVDHFDPATVDTGREDPDQLARLAKDSSGVSSAVHVLEAIAVEGREWISLERTRMYRRLPRRRTVPGQPQGRELHAPPVRW